MNYNLKRFLAILCGLIFLVFLFVAIFEYRWRLITVTITLLSMFGFLAAFINLGEKPDEQNKD